MAKKSIAKISIQEDLKKLKASSSSKKKVKPAAVAKIAATPKKEPKKDMVKKFATFYLDGSAYAIDVENIIRIESWVNSTKSLIDLCTYFGQGVTHADEKNVVILVPFGKKSAGILANGIGEVISVKKSEIEAVNGKIEKGIEGIISVKGKTIRILDMVQLENFNDY